MRWKSSAFSPSRSVCGTNFVVPALFTSASSRPHLSSAACTSRRQSASCETFACTRIDSLQRAATAFASCALFE
jgi:hypothetical protein